MKRSALTTVALLLSFSTLLSAAAQAARAEEWIQLFNGENLDGWTAKIRGYEPGENFGNTFRVEDGLLKVSYDQYERFDARFGHLFYNDTFSHYIIRAEYRFTGQQAPGGAGWALRNSGLMLHGESPATMAKDQSFPVSIEVQLLGGNGTDPRPTANLCTPGTHVVMDGALLTRHCTDSTSKTYHGDQWVTVEVEVRGNRLFKHKIDGQTVIAYSAPQYDDTDPHARELAGDGDKMISRGTISLQSESHPIEFRKVELMVLEE